MALAAGAPARGLPEGERSGSYGLSAVPLARLTEHKRKAVKAMGTAIAIAVGVCFIVLLSFFGVACFVVVTRAAFGRKDKRQ